MDRADRRVESVAPNATLDVPGARGMAAGADWHILCTSSASMKRLVGFPVAIVLAAGCGGGKNLPSWEERELPISPPQTMYVTAPDAAGGQGGGGGAAGDGDGDAPSNNGGPGSGGAGNGDDDGGVRFDAAGSPSPQGRPRVCLELSTCCARPKACDREIFACQELAMIGDATICERVLDFYETVGCDNKLNIGAQILTGFPGCIPKPGGGFY